MAQTEAQRRADARYRKKHTTTVVIRLYPTDSDIAQWMENQPNKQGYLKALIRQDMERQASVNPGSSDALSNA
ncbi:hypothetical protein K6V98_03625 [Collinsella sp. AGMB00827]|uniref:Antitoxin n=1 Tax=Collinsella ureilytica TaxID=2869515 RepID=A0ABS7MJ92_9ACTN|nr:hypothetical protein [Collinsella urealyticum]MBY4797446.1 hypothetical protein [Collinsella urealyticum]